MSQENTVKNIKGPVTFRIWTKGLQKIYMFGDMHVRSMGKCPDSKDIVEVLNSITQPYDLYVEGAPEHANEEIELTNYLRDVLKLVQSNNVINVKYSDARHIFFDFYLTGICHLFSTLEQCCEYLSKNKEISPELLNSYINEVAESVILYYKHESETNDLLDKPLNTLKKMNIMEEFKIFKKSNNENKEKADLLLDFLKTIRNENLTDEFNNLLNMYLNLLGSLFLESDKKTPKEPSNKIAETFFKIVQPKFLANFTILSNRLALLGGLYMYFYLLFHLFKNNNTHNVIYAGEIHIENYTRALRALDYNEEYAVSDLKQCIPLGNNKLPLFS